MKKFVVYLFAFLSLTNLFLLGGCCFSTGVQNEYSSTDSLVFRFNDYSVITKVELLGVNKTINVNKSEFAVTFNPADSMSSFRVHNNWRSGEIIIRNNRLIKTDDRPCGGSKYTITYKPELIRTTYNKVNIKFSQYDNKKHDVEIVL